MNEKDWGKPVLVDGHLGIRFERYLQMGAERVWRLLTEPRELGAWMAEAEVELRVGGAYVLHFPDGDARCRVSTMEPYRLLQLDWASPHTPGGALMRAELLPEHDACRLVLVFALFERGPLADLAVSWHIKLDYMRDYALGQERPIVPTNVFRAYYRPAFAKYRHLIARPGRS
jgi:uncharacterized protein YndB with AHSA1/START domain